MAVGLTDNICVEVFLKNLQPMLEFENTFDFFEFLEYK